MGFMIHDPVVEWRTKRIGVVVDPGNGKGLLTVRFGNRLEKISERMLEKHHREIHRVGFRPHSGA